MDVNVVETISVVTSVLAVGGVIIAYMRSINMSIDKLFTKLDQKVNTTQCTADRVNCPCVINVNRLFESHNTLSKKVDVQENKLVKLEQSVAIHHSKFEKCAK